MNNIIVKIIFISIFFYQGQYKPTGRLAQATDMNNKNQLIHFPNVSGKNLNGKKYTFPQDFSAAKILVLIAFKREQQAQVDTWFPFADSLEQTLKDFRYYEFPTLSQFNPLFQWFINRGMRSGIQDYSARKRTVSFYINKEPFKNALNIQTEDTIYIMLLDKSGRIHWRTNGNITDQKTESLYKSIKDM
jgi:hypothetical protein